MRVTVSTSAEEHKACSKQTLTMPIHPLWTKIIGGGGLQPQSPLGSTTYVVSITMLALYMVYTYLYIINEYH